MISSEPTILATFVQLAGHISPTHWTNVSKTVCYVSFRKNLLRSCRNMSSIGSEIPTCILPPARCRRCSICPTQSVPCGRARRTGRAVHPLSRQGSPSYRFHSHSLPASCRQCGAGICQLSHNRCLRSAQSRCPIGCILLGS